MRWGTLLTLLFYCTCTIAQPTRDWDKTFGSSNWDELHTVISLPSGELLLASNLAGYEGTISDTTFGKNDFWIQKTDALGALLWQKTYGGSEDDKLWTALALEDGRILLGGSSASSISGNKTTAGFGGLDYWIVMLDAQGEKLWEKNYGSTGSDYLFDIAIHKDGGFVLAGFSDGNADGTKSTNSFGAEDLWILHIDEAGNELWQTQIGGNGFDNVYKIHALSGGSFLLAGATSSARNHSVSQVGFGESDMWLVKIDAVGNKLWDKRYGGKKAEQAYCILPLRDGHFLLGGTSASVPHGKKLSPNYGKEDFWAIKVTPTGQQIWENSYGGNSLDVLYDAKEGEDGSLYFAGVSDSNVSGNKSAQPLGGYDYWLLKCSSTGEKLWDATYGGEKDDALTQLTMLDDGALILAGHSASDAGHQKTEDSYGLNDIWLFKTFCALDLELPEDAEYCKHTEQTIAAWSACQNDCIMYWENGLHTGFEHTFFTKENTRVQAQLFDRNGCTVRDTFSYAIRPDLDIDLGASDTVAHEQATILLNAPSADAATWAWSTGGSNPFIRVSESGNYAVTVTDKNGCTGTDSIEVCLCLKDEVFIPNVFNPENSSDYRNQRWYIQANPSVLRAVDFIEIYSSQGHLVHQSMASDFGNPLTGWDGRDRNGRVLSAGVYTYRVGLQFERGAEEVRFGTVTLVR